MIENLNRRLILEKYNINIILWIYFKINYFKFYIASAENNKFVSKKVELSLIYDHISYYFRIYLKEENKIIHETIPIDNFDMKILL